MNAWTMFFTIVGVAAVVDRLFRIVDFIEGVKNEHYEND